MSLRFNPQTGLSVDDVAVVREVVRQDWVQAFRQRPGLPDLRTEPETPAGQLIDSQTNAIVQKDNEVLYLGNQFNPLTAEGIWQDALAKIYFLTRKVEQQSVCVCVCTGLSGTVIPAGAVIKSTADEMEWVCTEPATITSLGTVSARFTSKEGGAVEAPANTLTQIVTVIPGWDTVNNEVPAVIGRVAETQAEFEQRRFNSVAKNARGSLAAIYGALADISNVIDCVVLENTTNETIESWGVQIPGHSIWVTIVGGDDAEIAETIYRKKDAGCGTAGNTQVTFQDRTIPGEPIYNYLIERPEPLSFGVKVSLIITSDTPSNIVDLVKDAVIQDFSGLGPHSNLRVGSAMKVFASRFYCSVITAGVKNLVSIEIKAGGGSWGDGVTINADKTPVLDRDNIVVDIQE